MIARLPTCTVDAGGILAAQLVNESRWPQEHIQPARGWFLDVLLPTGEWVVLKWWPPAHPVNAPPGRQAEIDAEARESYERLVDAMEAAGS